MSIMRFKTALLYGLLFVLSFAVCGATYAYAAEDEKRIYDEAGLLTASEYEKLEDMCLEYGEEAGIEIYILTHDNAKAVDAETYAENFADKKELVNSVILLIDMYNRDVVIQGYGTAEIYIHSFRGDSIREDITPYLSDGEFYTAFEKFIKESAKYMKDDSYLNTYGSDYNYDKYGNYVYNDRSPERKHKSEGFLTNTWFQLIASLVIGGLVVGVMAYNSGGKMTVRGNDYLDQSRSGLIGRRDIYLRTTITKVRKPTEKNSSSRGGFNSGGFRGGSSSGGRSHSSSRGKF